MREFTEKEQFITTVGDRDESVFLIEKTDEGVFLLSDMERVDPDCMEDVKGGLRIEEMYFEIFVDGATDFLEEVSDCRGRNCGGITFYDEDVEDDDEVREDFYDHSANGYIVRSNDNVYEFIKRTKNGYYYVCVRD